MAVMSEAIWRPVTNCTKDEMLHPIKGIVCHHTVGSLASAENRFNDRSSKASAHFGVDFDGTILQWVDTNDAAWHAVDANWTGWIGVEFRSFASSEGDIWEGLYPPQIIGGGKILRFLHDLEGTPIQVTDDPNIGGVAYHKMCPSGSPFWGNTGCPGDNIINQRHLIVAAALGQEDDMPSNEEIEKYFYEDAPFGITRFESYMKKANEKYLLPTLGAWENDTRLFVATALKAQAGEEVDVQALAEQLNTLLGDKVAKQVATELSKRLED